MSDRRFSWADVSENTAAEEAASNSSSSREPAPRKNQEADECQSQLPKPVFTSAASPEQAEGESTQHISMASQSSTTEVRPPAFLKAQPPNRYISDTMSFPDATSQDNSSSSSNSSKRARLQNNEESQGDSQHLGSSSSVSAETSDSSQGQVSTPATAPANEQSPRRERGKKGKGKTGKGKGKAGKGKTKGKKKPCSKEQSRQPQQRTPAQLEIRKNLIKDELRKLSPEVKEQLKLPDPESSRREWNLSFVMFRRIVKRIRAQSRVFVQP